MSANRNGAEVPDETAVQDDDHLSDVPDGAGCTEIWEHISENREDAEE